MKRFINNVSCAFIGLRHAALERNFQILLAVGVAVLLLAYWVRVSREDLAFIVLTITFVLGMEAMNTAVEEICDKFHPETHPHIALIKDLAVGAVLIASIGAAIVGIIVFYPYFF